MRLEHQAIANDVTQDALVLAQKLERVIEKLYRDMWKSELFNRVQELRTQLEDLGYFVTWTVRDDPESKSPKATVALIECSVKDLFMTERPFA
jgi:hypothetical protein